MRVQTFRKQNLCNVSLNKGFVVQKSGKCNFIVTVDRGKFIKKMENFLSDQSQFQSIPSKD